LPQAVSSPKSKAISGIADYEFIRFDNEIGREWFAPCGVVGNRSLVFESNFKSRDLEPTQIYTYE
jgi:hypothetical protein